MNYRRLLPRLISFLLALTIVVALWLTQPWVRLNETQGFVPVDKIADNSLQIAIWNLHNQKSWLGDDNNAVIRQQILQTSLGQSDLIALQEVRQIDRITTLAKDSGFGFYGKRDAILSKFPVLETGLATANPEGRTAFWADIDWHGTKLRVYSIHLTFKKNGSAFISQERGEEISEIIRHSQTFNGPVILAGDFNTLSLLSGDYSQIPVFTALQQSGFNSSKPLGECDTQIPLGEQDWIYFRGLELVRNICGNYAGSDHRWVQAELRLPQQ